MNAKQAKKSRQLQRKIDKHLAVAERHLRAQKETNITEIIAMYHKELYRMSFIRRARFCFRVMQCGRSMWNFRTMLYFAALFGAVAFYLLVR